MTEVTDSGRARPAAIRPGGRQARPRPRFRVVEVAEVRRPGARWVTVVLGGDELAGFQVDTNCGGLRVWSITGYWPETEKSTDPVLVS